MVAEKSLPIALPMAELAEFRQRYRVREPSLFGSVLRDDVGPESDLDLLVLFRPDATIGFLEPARMQRELLDVVGRSVDLVPKRGLKPVVRDEVLASARVLYAED